MRLQEMQHQRLEAQMDQEDCRLGSCTAEAPRSALHPCCGKRPCCILPQKPGFCLWGGTARLSRRQARRCGRHQLPAGAAVFTGSMQDTGAATHAMCQYQLVTPTRSPLWWASVTCRGSCYSTAQHSTACRTRCSKVRHVAVSANFNHMSWRVKHHLMRHASVSHD